MILSGANSDGAMGLKEIAEYKGICVVQDPNEAEFNRMPKSAIKATKVDYILPINEIIELLMSLPA